jgi:hypothetical protein
MLQYTDINQIERYWKKAQESNLNFKSLTKFSTIIKHVFKQNYRKDKKLD